MQRRRRRGRPKRSSSTTPLRAGTPGTPHPWSRRWRPQRRLVSPLVQASPRPSLEALLLTLSLPIDALKPRRPLSRTLRAAQTGDLAALRALAAEGQWDANERDRNGATPLLWAAGGGHLGVVRFLVEEAGVDAADLQTGRRGYAGRSALHWACRNGHVGVAAYLVGKGCAKDIATQDGTTPFHFAAWQGE
mmetsp:Transcript_23020/g.71607  ORF Transcript_23020/g.71607 Transcript_23020/m.71607 type:complete len:191 (+) Transcript_23020:876-1448(+)